MKEKYIQVGGRKVAYLMAGSGLKPVFLLHGWGGSKESWTALLEKLVTSRASEKSVGAEYSFVALDFPGFGQSDEPAVGWDVTDYASWLERFVAAIYGAEKLSGDYGIIVHSFGGRVLLKLYAKDFQHTLEARPEKLVLVAAAGVKHSRSWRVRIAAMAARIGKIIIGLPVLRRLAPLAQKILYKALKTHDYEKSSGVMRETFLKVIDEDLQGSIEKIHRPTLIIWGDKDSYVPVKDAYLMHEKIAGSELHIIEGGRHGIHKTHSKIVAEWIREFLKK